jgi:hypothetical protein
MGVRESHPDRIAAQGGLDDLTEGVPLESRIGRQVVDLAQLLGGNPGPDPLALHRRSGRTGEACKNGVGNKAATRSGGNFIKSELALSEQSGPKHQRPARRGGHACDPVIESGPPDPHRFRMYQPS